MRDGGPGPIMGVTWVQAAAVQIQIEIGRVKKRAGLFASLLCTDKMDMWTAWANNNMAGGDYVVLLSVEGLFIFCLHSLVFLSFF